MVNYENGKIYKLYSLSKNIVYFGSTAEKYLSKRLQHHLADYKKYKNNKKNFITSFKVLECEDYKIELIEEINCNNIDQLRERERFYIENNDCINKKIPNRTNKEYHKEWEQNNKEHIKEYKKEYYENNKEHYKEHKSQKVICECGCEITRSSLTKHKKSLKHINKLNEK